MGQHLAVPKLHETREHCCSIIENSLVLAHGIYRALHTSHDHRHNTLVGESFSDLPLQFTQTSTLLHAARKNIEPMRSYEIAHDASRYKLLEQMFELLQTGFLWLSKHNSLDSFFTKTQLAHPCITFAVRAALVSNECSKALETLIANWTHELHIHREDPVFVFAVNEVKHLISFASAFTVVCEFLFRWCIEFNTERHSTTLDVCYLFLQALSENLSYYDAHVTLRKEELPKIEVVEDTNNRRLYGRAHWTPFIMQLWRDPIVMTDPVAKPEKMVLHDWIVTILAAKRLPLLSSDDSTTVIPCTIFYDTAIELENMCDLYKPLLEHTCTHLHVECVHPILSFDEKQERALATQVRKSFVNVTHLSTSFCAWSVYIGKLRLIELDLSFLCELFTLRVFDKHEFDHDVGLFCYVASHCRVLRYFKVPDVLIDWIPRNALQYQRLEIIDLAENKLEPVSNPEKDHDLLSSVTGSDKVELHESSYSLLLEKKEVQIDHMFISRTSIMEALILSDLNSHIYVTRFYLHTQSILQIQRALEQSYRFENLHLVLNRDDKIQQADFDTVFRPHTWRIQQTKHLYVQHTHVDAELTTKNVLQALKNAWC